MAQPIEPIVPVKRPVGRPRRDAAQPVAKKQKLSIPSGVATPSAIDSPLPSQAHTPRSGLPSRISASLPLPTLLQSQSADFSDAEYQSLASSAVLGASLERSRLAWTHDGVFKRFWTKGEVKLKSQDALLQQMKSRGRCRLRIEPHIFEVEVWVVEKLPPVLPPVKRPLPSASYSTPYRAPNPAYAAPQTQYYQRQAIPSRVHSPAQPLAPVSQPASTPAPQTARPSEKKQSPDPVISMLATRASSDPELKALMKEVATGQATQDQLRIFQKHIDELTSMIQARRAKETTEQPQPKIAQYDGADDERPPPQSYTPSYTSPAPQTYTPPPPAVPPEVVFAFTAAGATEDRFLFPQHSILESLSQQHVLASFMVTRDSYWQPVTLMIEVAYGREGILKDIMRWVKPAEEVRDEMRKVMKSHTRAPESYLAMRLPVKGSGMAESERVSLAGTPAAEEVVVKPKRAYTKRASIGTTAGKAKATDSPAAVATPAVVHATDGQADEAEKKDDEGNGRPKRVTRKSVRISEV